MILSALASREVGGHDKTEIIILHHKSDELLDRQWYFDHSSIPFLNCVLKDIVSRYRELRPKVWQYLLHKEEVKSVVILGRTLCFDLDQADEDNLIRLVDDITENSN